MAKGSIEYQLGYQDGWRDCAEKVIKYIEPAELALYNVNSSLVFIAGIAAAGFGQLPRAILKDANTHLGAAMAAAVNAFAYARGAGGLQLETPDLSAAMTVFELVKNYLENPQDDGTALRGHLAQLDTARALGFQHREALRPGAKRQTGVSQALNDEAHELVSAGLSIQQVLDRLWQNDEYRTLMDRWRGDPVEALKKRLQRRKLRGQNVLSPPT